MKSLAPLFKALGEPVRLRVLTLLFNGERCVCDLMAVLDMPQSTVSRHLAYLKNTGWIEGERRGVWMYYRLSEIKGLQGELLKLLTAYLPATEEGKADITRLKNFLESKAEDACS